MMLEPNRGGRVFRKCYKGFWIVEEGRVAGVQKTIERKIS
jgi:hypothetical protein